VLSLSGAGSREVDELLIVDPPEALLDWLALEH
jgi:hypothetical protein